MQTAHRLPLALVALGTASPVLAHEADFFHTHGEGLMVGAAVALTIGAAFVWKAITKRSQK